MRLRLIAASFLVLLAGCASTSPAAFPSSPSLPSPSSSAEIISGTVAAGVEPHCLVLRDAAGSHSLYFQDESLRPLAPAGAKVTLVGHASPGMMTTCQQGEPFIVTEVRKN
jgi:hypothetical protein